MKENNITKKYAYITLLTNDEYLPVVLGLYASLNRNTTIPLICMVSYEVSDPVLDKLTKYGIKYKKFPTLSFPQRITIDKFTYFSQNNISLDSFHDSLMKLWALSFYEYDKVIFLDADLFIMENIDNLFELPHFSACQDGNMIKEELDELHANNSGMYDYDFHNRLNSGLLVLEPTQIHFDEINEYMHRELYQRHPDSIINDQEVFSFYAQDMLGWNEREDLHISEYYNIFAPHLNNYLNVINFDQSKVKVYHFVGIKPTAYAVSSLTTWDKADPTTLPYIQYINTLINFLNGYSL